MTMDRHRMHCEKNEMPFEHTFSNEILHRDAQASIENLLWNVRKENISCYSKDGNAEQKDLRWKILVFDLLKILKEYLTLWLMMFAENIIQSDLQRFHEIIDHHSLVSNSAGLIHSTMTEFFFISCTRRFTITFWYLFKPNSKMKIFVFLAENYAYCCLIHIWRRWEIHLDTLFTGRMNDNLW